MVGMINKILKAAIIAVAGMASIVGPAFSQQALTSTGERYIPTIWVDPDGCEHWVMDDGAEGYMSPHLTRDGLPVCKRGNTCGVL